MRTDTLVTTATTTTMDCVVCITRTKWGKRVLVVTGARERTLIQGLLEVERDERSDEESEADEEEEPEEEDERSWEQRKGTINTKLASLSNNCMLNNLTNQRNLNSRLPKAR